MDKPVMEFEAVSKSYGDGERAIWALDDVTLKIRKGEFVAITGPSGSGKSTLLNLAGGLDLATSGDVRVAGRSIGDMSANERAAMRRETVAIVFQFANLIDVLTAERNVALPLRAAGLTGPDVEERAQEALRAVGLADRADHYPSELSGGELQRVGIARAIATNAPVILADEPTGSLDTVRGEAVLEILRDAVDEQDKAVVMVTHDLQAASYGDRIVTLRDGKVVDEVDGAGKADVFSLHDT